MNKKISLILLFLILGINVLIKAQTITLSVCGYVQSPSSLPYVNPVNMDLFINGVLVSSQTNTMNGSPNICFNAVDVETNGASELSFSVTTSILGCVPNSYSGVVNSSDTILVELLQCFQNCNAYITPVSTGGNNYNLQATGNGVPPLTYSWSNGSTDSSIPLNTSQFYSVTVTDSLGCISSANFSPFISGSVFSTLNSNNTLSLETTVFNGLLPYTYVWNNGETTPVITVSDLSPIIYCVTITDAIGTSITLCDTIGQCYSTITESPSGLPFGILQANSYGTAPYTYLWNTGETSQFVVANQNGNYSVIVTDALGCTFNTDYFYLQNAPCIQLILTNQSNPTTFNLTAITSGVEPFAYSWSGNGVGVNNSTPNLTVTQSGIYCCTITDATGCISYSCDTIDLGNTPNCFVTITNTSAVTFPGSLTATGTGVEPLNYVWTDSNGAVVGNNSLYFPIANGLYCCTITDAFGCVNQSCYYYSNTGDCYSAIETITSPNVPPNAVGGLFVNTYNAIAPFSYSWLINGILIPNTTDTIPVSESGFYKVVVVDGLGCISSDSIYIDLNLGGCSANISWTANPLGGITFTANSNGIPPFQYFWSNGSTSQSIVSLAAGSYSVSIIDAIGCVSISSVVDSVSSLPCYATLSMSSPILGIPPTLTASGNGLAPLNFSWTLNGLAISETTQSISPNGIGTYCVLITDANGCTAQACYNVNGGSNCQTTIVDSIAWNSHILIAYSTGVPPFTYQWLINNAQIVDTTSAIIISQSGIYSVIVTDALGCTSMGNLFVDVPQCLAVTNLEFDLNSNLTTIIAGSTGVAPYTYSWTLNGLPLVGEQSISPSINGNYCYTVTDATGCQVSDCYYYTSNPQGNCTAYFSFVIDSLFIPSSNMMLVDFVSYPNGSPDFTYFWTFSDGATDTVANPQHWFASSPYLWAWANLTIIDANGCVSSYSNSIPLPYYQQTCFANFSYSSSYSTTSVGEINFQNFSITNSQNVTYLWNFGDGTISSLENPNHIYTANGMYNVMLTINNDGCVSNYASMLYVDLAWWGNNPYGGTCTSGFILLPQFTIDGLAFLVNISQVNNANYLWTISNGTIANGENPLFNLNGAGVYSICLTATDTISGCSDTFCDSLTLDSLGNVFRTANNMFLSNNSTIGLAVVSSPKSTNPSAISELKNENLISVQPNPANDNITIKLTNTEAVNINIFSVSGELVKELRINNSTTTVDVSELSNGIYFVKVISKEINQTTKLVINH